MAAKKRRNTQPGIGAVSAGVAPEGVSPGVSGNQTEGDSRPLAMRDTVLAMRNLATETNHSGERAVAHGEPVAPELAPVSAATSSAAPVSAAPSSGALGRYSSQPRDENVAVVSPAPPPRTTSGKQRRTLREPLRVDEVGATSLMAAHAVSLAARPRLVDREQVSRASLSRTEAYVLTLVDGRHTVQNLIDATLLSEEELRKILARLERLGILHVPT